VYAELGDAKQLIARYLHGYEFDQTFARVIYSEPGVSTPGFVPEVHWLLTGQLNSMRLVLDKSDDVLDQIAHNAFVNIVVQLNRQLVNPILFTSREFDAERGLYYNRACPPPRLLAHPRPLDEPRPPLLRRRGCEPVPLPRQQPP